MRTYAQAVAYAKAVHLNPPYYVQQTGKCQMFARNCVGAQAWAGTALNAWNAVPASHKIPGKVVNGGLTYFDDPHRSGEAGHAVFAMGNGYVWSTDILRSGHVDLVHYSVITSKWGMRLLGTINWTPSGAINMAPAVIKPPAPVYTYRQNKQVYSSKMHLGTLNSDSVWNVNLALYQKHYGGTPVDDFTPATQAAVKKFQLAQGWTGAQADGIPGPMTVAHLGLTWVVG
jgi:hypothetical protein